MIPTRGQNNHEGETMKRSTDERTTGDVRGTHGCITPNGKPFYQLRLNAAALNDLLSMLDQAGERQWYGLTATAELPSRFRWYQIPTPNYEQDAVNGFRGTIYRISGRKSITIALSGHGALLFAERLREAHRGMREYVLLRVPDRETDLIEFLPDIELERIASDEHARLGQAGQSMAGQVWEQEDFSDWEQ